MHDKRILLNFLNVKGTTLKGLKIDKKEGSATFTVKPAAKENCRCGKCGRKSSVYDRGRKESRRWRSRDWNGMKIYLESDLVRVKCRKCGIVTQRVPWARLKSGFTYDFEQEITWLSLHMSKSALAEYKHIAWKTVGDIIGRVYKDLEKEAPDKFSNLKRIGIDETSYQKGHKYITVVVNHDTGGLIWAHEGHSTETLSKFFEELTVEQRASIKLVSGDGARWLSSCVEKYCPQAERCIDPFHVVGWAMEALDEVRTDAWRKAFEKMKDEKKRSRGRPKKGGEKKENTAQQIKGSKYPLGKAPENLTENQKVKLEMLSKSQPELYRAYLLKEKLRLIFHMKVTGENDLEEIKAELDSWRGWAWRSRIKPFVELQKKIKRHYEAILATMKYGLSNARIEATNNNIKLSIRMAYGFRNMENMLAMLMLRCSAIEVKLPKLEAA